ncbi:spore coat U domain-containing protein [Pseudidiomarina terrestris]|uniref:Csu type fimbrial protein n=1 Tax=Pseudidiomarina terrestris TaxID=2820060 RepID=UPI0026527633|nr:spore coat U domain-containing protein [Pseudidiomarina sp. 1ASP75-5]MDN7134565.1 spore coat protein U domain-containing protein [Pseudidiomarina sp. 1ASP75-5]
MKKLILTSLIATGVMSAAHAATETSTFQVTAEVAASCQITTNSLAFGSFDPSVGTTGSASLDVACTSGSSGTVTLGSGNMWAMSDGTNSLNYALYTDASHTSVWDNMTASQTVTGAGLATPSTFTVYGKIDAQPAAKVSAGYADTVTVTVTY